MKNQTVLAIDNAWNHRRNGTECVVTFLDTQRNKIVHSEFVRKSRARVEGNFIGPSNLMEFAGVERGWKVFIGNTRVVGYTHDRDNKTSKIIKGLDDAKTQYLDPNHVRKGISKAFDDANKASGKLLHELKMRLIVFWNWLKASAYSVDKKIALWLNAVSHYKGHYDQCIDSTHTGYEWKQKENPKALQALNDLLEKTKTTLAKCFKKTLTNSIESVNAMRAEAASKRIAYSVSYVARLSVAIFRKNDPDEWLKKAWETLRLGKLHESVVAMIEKLDKEKARKRAKSHLPEIHVIRAKERHRSPPLKPSPEEHT